MPTSQAEPFSLAWCRNLSNTSRYKQSRQYYKIRVLYIFSTAFITYILFSSYGPVSVSNTLQLIEWLPAKRGCSLELTAVIGEPIGVEDPVDYNAASK